ncbi:LysE family transporter [Polaribacter tangerinus]|uniref:LysE family transporter n=1 Tax=Polaribacter tangerinus TaxID=1920034 RepID=UPI000B4A824C|nr:LysE family transporter [Polaribacter tangerinus]
MILLSHFFFGFLFSFIGSITPSMLNMTALKISLEKGQQKNNWYAIGVAIFAIPQITVAVFLTNYIIERPTILETIEKVGIFIFLILSAYFYKLSKKENKQLEGHTNLKSNPFLTGIILSLLNVFSVPFFCGLIVGLDYFNLFSYELLPVTFFSFGAVVGTFYILYLYGKFSHTIRKKTGKLTKNIHLILAIITGFVGIFTLLKLFFKWI